MFIVMHGYHYVLYYKLNELMYHIRKNFQVYKISHIAKNKSIEIFVGNKFCGTDFILYIIALHCSFT